MCKWTLDIEFERDWPFVLGAMFRRRKKIKNYFFFSFRDFSGKSVILLGFKCAINPQNLIKIVGAILEKIKIFNFSHVNSCEQLEIFTRGPQISNVNDIGQLVQALRQATERKLKTIFLVSGIFPGKADSAILLIFESAINLQNLMKIVGAIFEKI